MKVYVSRHVNTFIIVPDNLVVCLNVFVVLVGEFVAYKIA